MHQHLDATGLLFGRPAAGREVVQDSVGGTVLIVVDERHEDRMLPGGVDGAAALAANEIDPIWPPVNIFVAPIAQVVQLLLEQPVIEVVHRRDVVQRHSDIPDVSHPAQPLVPRYGF